MQPELVVHPNCRPEPHLPAGRCRTRIPGPARRQQLIEVAAAVFASTGLRSTTTAMLADRAGVSEPVLYDHFETKDRLFREAVARNVDKRIRMLDRQLAAVPSGTLMKCVEAIAELTVMVCVCDGANALLTNWALLETPEYASELHRRELVCVRSMWDQALAARYSESPLFATLRLNLLPYATHACLGYGFWLAALRHSAATAGPVAHEFAVGIG